MKKNSGRTSKPTSIQNKSERPKTKRTATRKAGQSAGTDKAKAKAPANTKAKAPPKKKKADNVGLVNQKTATQMMHRLLEQYPDADCELDFDNTYQLLTSVILSAQTTDVQVNKVTPKLFASFPTAKALAEAPIDQVKELIKATGYYNAKAANIQKCAQALVSKFGGEVPRTLEELVELPGVGRKTANVVLGVAFGVPGWTVDTHVQRLSKRLGLTEQEDPYKIELDLQKVFPQEDWSKCSITLIWHGRRLCFARNPDCPGCPINNLCPASTV